MNICTDAERERNSSKLENTLVGRKESGNTLSFPTIHSYYSDGYRRKDGRFMCVQPSQTPYRKIYLWLFSTSSSLCSSKHVWTLQSSFLGMNCALCGIKHTQCKRKASAGVIHIWEDAPELLSDRERQEKRGWEPRIYPPTRYWFGEF